MLKYIKVGGKEFILTAYACTLTLTDVSSDDPREFRYEGGEGSVVNATVSSNEKYLCCTYDNKSACCWDIETGELLGNSKTSKKPTQIAIIKTKKSDSEEIEVLLVADKGGEVWATDIPHMKKNVRLFGHTGSVVTDMILGDPGTIITADRDEKIRVTAFPATYNINGYMLHHTDVVTSLATLDLGGGNGCLALSSGWDHRICLWNPSSCQLLDCLEDESPQITFTPAATEIPTRIDSEAPEEGTGGECGAAGGEEGGEENDGEDSGKYDIALAGSFPMRVIASPPCCDSRLAAVISYGTADVKFLGVDCPAPSVGKFIRKAGEEGRQAAVLGELCLPAPPLDCCFSPDGSHVLVLMPAPHYMAVYSVSLTQESGGGVHVQTALSSPETPLQVAASRFNSFASSQSKCTTKCSHESIYLNPIPSWYSSGLEATQKLSFSEDGGESSTCFLDFDAFICIHSIYIF